MTELVRLEVSNGVATVRLDRPKVNALNTQMQDELRQAADEAAAREDIAAVVLYGGPTVFAAGADVKEMAGLSYADMARRSRELQAAFTAVAQIPKPVVAAVAGYALGGGCELALTADVRFCEPTATFGQPEILLGIIPGAGGTQRLPRLVGPSVAKDLIWTGRFVGADEARAIGLVDRVVPEGGVYEEALAWASRFVGGPALAVAAAKQAVDTGLGLPMADALEVERLQFAALFATQDRTSGMSSFVTDGPGKATFQGR